MLIICSRLNDICTPPNEHRPQTGAKAHRNANILVCDYVTPKNVMPTKIKI